MTTEQSRHLAESLRAAVMQVQTEEAEALRNAFELSRKSAHPAQISAAVRECDTLLRRKNELQLQLQRQLELIERTREPHPGASSRPRRGTPARRDDGTRPAG